MTNKTLLIFSIAILTLFGVTCYSYFQNSKREIASNYGAPPYIEEPERDSSDLFFNPTTWKRPDGPIRVGLQAGHWKTNEMPDELRRIRESGHGTSNGVVAEWEVNLNIANETAKILEEKGIVVDVLPATVPESYWADVFVAIHADGSENFSVSGYKVAAPRRDITGKADELVQIIERKYGEHTNLILDPNITRNMTGYYAFSWRRYKHAVHPMTPSAILETGFLTNPSDAYMLVNNPQLPAQALADAIIEFLGI